MVITDKGQWMNGSITRGCCAVDTVDLRQAATGLTVEAVTVT